MTGKLLSSATQRHVTEGVVEPQAVEALQDSAGVSALHKQVVLAAEGGCRKGGCRSNTAGVRWHRESGVHREERWQTDVNGNYFSHVSLSVSTCE